MCQLFYVCRLYQGLALCKRNGGPGDRALEAIQHVLEVLEALLTKHTENALTTEDRSNAVNTAIVISS